VAKDPGVVAVEMDAAALYALSQVQRLPILCLQHVTNHIGLVEGDFEKGEAGGAGDALLLVGRLAATLAPKLPTPGQLDY
jgi:nucleoside phosphorylase